MRYEIIVPAAVWMLTFVSFAVILYNTSRRLAALESTRARRRVWLAGAALALGGAAGPAAIQAHATDGSAYWGGIPLLIAAAVLFSQTLRGQSSKPAIATFKEKSTAAMILAIIGVYGWATWAFLQSPSDLSAVFGLLIGSGIAVAIIMAISQAIFAIVRRPEMEDERDRLVGWRASRNGYRVMAVGVWGVLMLVFTHATPPVLAFALLGVFVLAELVRLASELAYSRLDL